MLSIAHVSACNLDNLLLTNPWKFPRLFFILIWFPFPIPCIHFTDFKIKPETEIIWMNLMKIWLLATNWLEMKWTMVVLSITPQWHSSYFFNICFLRKCKDFSMTQLLTHTVAHSTRPSFRPKTNNQPNKKFLSLAVTWVKVVKMCKILTFKVNFLCQKGSESF